MNCAWNELLALVPPWMRQWVDDIGREDLQELRLRVDKPPGMITGHGERWMQRKVTEADLRFCVNAACQYSPWSAESAAQGFITAPGGHRIGLCGESVFSGGELRGISTPASLCIRVARDFPGIADGIHPEKDSFLIIGCPGSGKTTLLRDLIRQISDNGPGSVSVVDERRELFPFSRGQACFSPGCRTDVLSGCGKAQGIDAVLRTMGPETIAVDEITAESDCDALLRAGWCGVRLLATAHAAGIDDLKKRPIYRKLWEFGLFQQVIVLSRDKIWTKERMIA